MLTEQQLQDHQQIKPGEMHLVLGNLIKYGINIWASFFYAFTRHTFGSRYFSARAFFGIFLLWTWESIMAPHADPLLHMVVGGIFFMIALCHGSQANFGKGNKVHSHFNGISRLQGKFWITNGLAKRFVEPLLVGLVGAALLQFDLSLGSFVIGGGVCCMLDDAAICDRNRERARRMRDAELEQEEIWDTYDEYYSN